MQGQDGRRIYLMRHGETLYQSRAAEGALGNGELTERGREQVASVALQAVAAHPQTYSNSEQLRWLSRPRAWWS